MNTQAPLFSFKQLFSLKQRLMALALLACLGSAETGAAVQSHETIINAASEAALAAARAQGFDNISIQARPLDSRLRLKHCEQALVTTSNPNAAVLGRTNIGVRCEGSEPWAIYVRLDVSATLDVPVLVTNLPRGTRIEAQHLSRQARQVGSDHASIVRDASYLLGKALDRDLAAGQPLRHRDVSAPRIIERGQLVTLVAGASGIQVQMQGRAASHAAVGDRIVVTNLKTGRRIEGIVTESGTVRVN